MQNNIIKYPTETEINNVIQNTLINYGCYIADIEELIAVGCNEEYATKLVAKRYEQFIIN